MLTYLSNWARMIESHRKEKLITGVQKMLGGVLETY